MSKGFISVAYQLKSLPGNPGFSEAGVELHNLKVQLRGLQNLGGQASDSRRLSMVDGTFTYLVNGVNEHFPKVGCAFDLDVLVRAFSHLWFPLLRLG